MGVFSNRIPREDLKPADHIYTWRSGYAYAHHGIYMGDGRVIHFTQRAGQEVGSETILSRFIFSSSPPISSIPCENCGEQIRRDGVIISCLDCFLSGGHLSLFKYSISLPVFVAHVRGGTCTFAVSDPPDEVLYKANCLLKHGFGTYDVFKNNCEDFAIYCKTGLLDKSNSSFGRSGQIRTIMSGLNALMNPMKYVIPEIGGLALVVSGIKYYADRYRSDIGIRRDITKIPIETFLLELGLEQTEPVVQMAAVETKDETHNQPETEDEIRNQPETEDEIRNQLETEEITNRDGSSESKPVSQAVSDC